MIRSGHSISAATVSPMSEAGLRSDAKRNRARILAAARTVFAAHGIDAPMNEIARQAGVGIATVFRRFPTREDLVAAVFADRMTVYAAAIDVALQDPDPWHGFCDYVRTVCSMQAVDRGFTEVLTHSFPTARGLEAERDEAFRLFTELIRRAKKAGGLRTDFVPEDLPMLLMANAGVVAATAASAPETSDRLVAYLLQAFAVTAQGRLPTPPTPQRMYAAMIRAQHTR